MLFIGRFLWEAPFLCINPQKSSVSWCRILAVCALTFQLKIHILMQYGLLGSVGGTQWLSIGM